MHGFDQDNDKNFDAKKVKIFILKVSIIFEEKRTVYYKI
jgi:hypothetical protein